MMPLSSVSYQTLAFTTAADLPTLIGRLGAAAGMEPQPDDLGNMQAVYRLDVAAGTPEAYVLTFPVAVSAADVQTVIDNCPTVAQAAAAAASAPATADDHAIASAALITAQLASVPVPRDQIATILQNLLGEAAAAIPFFEKYALDPSMTAPQWTAFQALDQTTKDRLLYDLVRSVAALMRYLSGKLPAA